MACGSAVFQHLQASLGPSENSGSDATPLSPLRMQNDRVEMKLFSIWRRLQVVDRALLDLQASRAGRDYEMDLASRGIVLGLHRVTVDQCSLGA
jgi:hypothetical protein